jgi:hypothetical protein
MEAAKTIAELFSHLFELEPEKKKWFESLNLTMPNYELEKAAESFAFKAIETPEDNPEAVEECIRRFKDGVFWYYANLYVLKKLSVKEFEKTLEIVLMQYSKDQCKFIEPADNDFNDYDVLDLIEVIQDEFKSGVEWAKNNKN